MENFDVEHVTVDSLPAKDVKGCVSPEKLEATLCVCNVTQSDDGVHSDGKGFRPEAAVPDLVPLDLRLPHAPRADHDVGALFKTLLELVEFADRALVVGIDESNDVAMSQGYTFADPTA